MKKLYLIAFFSGIIASAQAQNFVLWTFNSVPADANVNTGTTTPELNLAPSATYANVGSITTSYVTGYPNNPTGGDNSALSTSSYPAQGSNTAAGVRFNVSTAGRSGIIISLAAYNSNTASKFTRFQYSTNGGTTWVTPDLTAVNTFGSTAGSIDETNDLFVTPSATTWFYRVVNLTGVTGVDNNAQFAFRIIAAFDPGIASTYTATNSTSSYATSGAIRYDQVTVGENSTLPLTLTSFTGQNLNNGKVRLNWTVANEDDAIAYTIERSQDARTFTALGTVAASATKSANLDYSFTDATAMAGDNFYRLRAQFTNGKDEFSQTIRVNIGNIRNASVKVLNNPVLNDVTAQFEAGSFTRANLTDASGKIVATAGIETNATATSLPVSQLPAGIYLLSLDGGNATPFRQQIVKH